MTLTQDNRTAPATLGQDSRTSGSASFLLKEDRFYLLKEDGFKIVLQALSDIFKQDVRTF